MKINLINNIRFAYNKDYHDKLHQKLARQKNDLPLAQQLSAADEFCLSLEDKINEIESDGSDLDGYTFNELTNFLIELRLVVADYFSANFNNFHYPQELIKQYDNNLVLLSKIIKMIHDRLTERMLLPLILLKNF